MACPCLVVGGVAAVGYGAAKGAEFVKKEAVPKMVEMKRRYSERRRSSLKMQLIQEDQVADSDLATEPFIKPCCAKDDDTISQTTVSTAVSTSKIAIGL